MTEPSRGVCGGCNGDMYHDGLNWRHIANDRPRRECPPQRSEFYESMRRAEDVMDAVNARFSREHPTLGFSANEPISPSSMRFLAEEWERGEGA